MVYTEKRIIHRYIQDIKEYEEGGYCFGQVLPIDTQVYAVYSKPNKKGLFFVIGDGEHTYLEIREGYGKKPYNIEYMAVPSDAYPLLSLIKINNLQDGDYLRWNAEKNAWINEAGTPGPVPPQPVTEIDGGEVGTTEWALTLDGGNVEDIFDDAVDGGVIELTGIAADESMDGGSSTVIASLVLDGGSTSNIATNSIDSGLCI